MSTQAPHFDGGSARNPGRPSEAQEPVLSIRDLTRSFGPTKALTNVSLDLKPGEVVALLGKNGAGKSTLIKILAGVYTPSSGTYRLNGRNDADGSGVAFVHQDLGLIPSLTVAENIAYVSGFTKRGGIISWKAQRASAKRSLERWGFDIDPDATIESLDPTEKALVAITRALSTDAKVIVFDEPTAALPHSDVEILFNAVRKIRDTGVGVLYVTHRLAEVSALADRVVVLRDGQKVMDAPACDVAHETMVGEIIGENFVQHCSDYRSDSQEVALEIRGASCGRVNAVDLSVRRGEILGLFGLVSGGQRDVGKLIGGVKGLKSGQMLLNGQDFAPSSPRDAISRGVAYLSSSRLECGFAGFSTSTNFWLRRSPVRMVKGEEEAREAGEVFETWGITPADPDAPLGSLSGGNQQRVLLSKWVEFGPKLLVVDEPGAGVDIGARQALHERIDLVAQSGVPVVVVSTDAEEMASLAHRAIVFDFGVACAELVGDELTAERITLESSRDSVKVEAA